MKTSEVIVHEGGGVTFIGQDAVRLYKAMALVSALELYARSEIIPTRGMTITRLMAIASSVSGKKYGRGQALIAAEDVQVWIEVMKSAMPVSRVLKDENLEEDAE